MTTAAEQVTLSLKGSQSAEPVVKKGKKSWSPSNLGDIIKKEDGFRYRRVRKDDDNIAKKVEEGWQFVNGTTDRSAEAVHPSGRPNEPHKLTSNVEGRDWVAMRLDEETAQARDEFINAKTDRTQQALMSQTKRELGKEGAPVHGSITMEKKGVRTIIKD